MINYYARVIQQVWKWAKDNHVLFKKQGKHKKNPNKTKTEIVFDTHKIICNVSRYYVGKWRKKKSAITSKVTAASLQMLMDEEFSSFNKTSAY